MEEDMDEGQTQKGKNIVLKVDFLKILSFCLIAAGAETKAVFASPPLFE